MLLAATTPAEENSKAAFKKLSTRLHLSMTEVQKHLSSSVKPVSSAPIVIGPLLDDATMDEMKEHRGQLQEQLEALENSLNHGTTAEVMKKLNDVPSLAKSGHLVLKEAFIKVLEKHEDKTRDFERFKKFNSTIETVSILMDRAIEKATADVNLLAEKNKNSPGKLIDDGLKLEIGTIEQKNSAFNDGLTEAIAASDVKQILQSCGPALKHYTTGIQRMHNSFSSYFHQTGEYGEQREKIEEIKGVLDKTASLI